MHGYVVVLEVCSSIISSILSRVGRASVSTSTNFGNSHFVNSHFVNSHFVNIDQIGIDEMGIDKVGRFTILDAFKHCYS